MAESTTIEMPNIQTSKTRVAVRLAKAVRYADESMKAFRSARVRHMQQFAGSAYGPRNVDKAEPLNSLYGLVQTLLPVLAIDPTSEVSTDLPGLGPFSEAFSLAINRVVDEIRLGETFLEVIVDALFCVGITYTGLAAGQTGQLEDMKGWLHDADEPFCDRISLDDYIPDLLALKREAFTFEGHRFRLNYEWAMGERDLFKHDLLAKLGPQAKDEGGRKVQDMSRRGEPNSESRWIDEIEVLSLWLPDERAIVTIPARVESTEDFLSEAEWDGPEEGPYNQMSFMLLPDNPLGAAVVPAVYDLHLFQNAMGRKIKRQAERQKIIGLYDLAVSKDAETIKNASDGQMVGVSNVDRVKELSLSGGSEHGYKALMFAQEWFNRIAGNPDAVGGLGAQSETLGQDQLLWSNASAKISFWRKQIMTTARRVLQKVGYFVWNDPARSMNLRQELSGGQSVPINWTPDFRRGRFEDYRIEATPYGIASDTPERRYERIIRWVAEVLLPLSNAGMAQGQGLDVAAVAQITGDLANIPHASEIFHAIEPVQAPAVAGGGAPRETTNISLGGQARPTPQREFEKTERSE